MQMAMRRVRATWLLALGLATFSVLALAPRPVQAGFGGRIFVSDAPFGSFASEKDMNAAIKRQSKTAFKGDGSWNLNFMVFLNAAPGADKINIVYYDVSKKKEQVNFAEVGVKPDQKIVQLNDQTISKDLGFVKGHQYEVRATRLIGGKEKVYAKTVITLK
jgi:hypothetical protein